MAKNNETRFFYVLYPDETWFFDQSDCAPGPIYFIMFNKHLSGEYTQSEERIICK